VWGSAVAIFSQRVSFLCAVTRSQRGFAVPRCKAGARYSECLCVYAYEVGGAAVFMKPPAASPFYRARLF